MNERAQRILAIAAIISALLVGSKTAIAAGEKTMAQKALEEVAVAHPEIAGLELAASRSTKQSCSTVAATDSKEIGEKCDKDEFTVMRTNRAFIEEEKDGFDITMPLHDSLGKIIGTVGMDFKPETGQTRATVTAKANQVASELEKRLKSKHQLFEPAR
jgi:hypothetical protein